MLIEVDNDEVLEMLMERVRHWVDDEEVIGLYEQMYENYIDADIWDGGEFNVWTIVDNDYVNWCNVISEGEENFDEIKEVFMKQGLGDCSCQIEHIGCIEAVDDEHEPTMFLIRW